MAAWHGVSAWLLIAPVAAMLIKVAVLPVLRQLAVSLQKAEGGDAMTFWIAFALGSGLMMMIFSSSPGYGRENATTTRWWMRCGRSASDSPACLWLIVCGGGSVRNTGSLVRCWRCGAFGSAGTCSGESAGRIRRRMPGMSDCARFGTGRVPSAFFWFFQAQGLSVVLLALAVPVDRGGSGCCLECLGIRGIGR